MFNSAGPIYRRLPSIIMWALGSPAADWYQTGPKILFGIGMALGWLNQDLFEQDTELVLQTYYQAHVTGAVSTETALSYIPQPAAQPGLDAAWAVTQQFIVSF